MTPEQIEELAERLRRQQHWYPRTAGHYSPDPINSALCKDAAAALLSLAAQAERMKEALEKIADQLVCTQGRGATDPDVVCYCPNCDRSLRYVQAIARAALAAAEGAGE